MRGREEPISFFGRRDQGDSHPAIAASYAQRRGASERGGAAHRAADLANKRDFRHVMRVVG